MPQPAITYHPAKIHYFTENLDREVTMDMVLIPAGTFKMGSLQAEEGHYPDESPQHDVAVSSFFMGQKTVTQLQWQAVARMPRINIELKSNPTQLQVSDLPVGRISWVEAIEFCQRLFRYTKREYRLPSEAEWEYACRAGTEAPFHFGETIDAKLANYRAKNEEIGGTKYLGEYGPGGLGEYGQQTIAVGSFPPNPFGLYDMHGNLWEWCQDSWHDSYENAPTDGTPWEEKGDSYHVLRGGSWLNPPRNCRSACRNHLNYDVNINVGFRVVCCAPRTLT
jgi:formylglycine-generating enzyme required for sulfatase activity